jgi:hypothetical protein
MKNRLQVGFAHIQLLVAVAIVILAIGAVGSYVVFKSNASSSSASGIRCVDNKYMYFKTRFSHKCIYLAQNILNGINAKSTQIAADSEYGDGTKSSIIKFQKSVGYTGGSLTGTTNNKTWKDMCDKVMDVYDKLGSNNSKAKQGVRSAKTAGCQKMYSANSKYFNKYSNIKGYYYNLIYKNDAAVLDSSRHPKIDTRSDVYDVPDINKNTPWNSIAASESNQNWKLKPNYATASGGIQFIKSTWKALGCDKLAGKQEAYLDSKANQITCGKRAYYAEGWRPWAHYTANWLNFL